MKRKVYIGRGETIEVEELNEKMNILDIDKVKKLLEEYEEVTVGAEIDFYFTAITLKKNDIPDLISGKKVLLRSSCWDSFIVKLPHGERVDVTITVDKKIWRTIYIQGFSEAANKIKFWFDIDVIYDLLVNLKYEEIKKMAKEVKEIFEKYLEKPKSEVKE